MNHWPTPEIPKAPISAETHGEPKGWLELEWAVWREWAISLKGYGPPKKEKRNVQGTKTRIPKQRDGLPVRED